MYKDKYVQQKSEYKVRYQEFLKKHVGGKKKQEEYHASLKEYKAKMKEYMKQFRLKKKNLLKVCVFV